MADDSLPIHAADPAGAHLHTGRWRAALDLIESWCEDGQLPAAGILRTPHMAARGTYTLGLYGVAPQYDVAAWKQIFDSFAEPAFAGVRGGHADGEAGAQYLAVRRTTVACADRTAVGLHDLPADREAKP